jgi:tRNA modification GTPase
MAAPRSYTREDVVELHLPGNPLLVTLLVTELCRWGARRAEPGEFTRRAFLSGRIDLSQAEAVMALISASDEAQARAGLELLSGDFGRDVTRLRDDALDLLAVVEASIDFSDQDIEIAERGEVEKGARELEMRTEGLIARAPAVRTEGDALPRILLFGPVNAGKSSLFNALVGEELALVGDGRGTTREGIEVTIRAGGIAIRLRDTAGLLEDVAASLSAEGDRAESSSLRMTKELLGTAEAVLLVLDVGGGSPPDLDALLGALSRVRVLVVLNKSDCAPPAWAGPLRQDLLARGLKVLSVSARSGEGIGPLIEAMGTMLGEWEGDDVEAARVGDRHHAALQVARDALARAREASARDEPIELVAADLDQASRSLGEITGATTADDVLDRIFSRFCIGK